MPNCYNEQRRMEIEAEINSKEAIYNLMLEIDQEIEAFFDESNLSNFYALFSGTNDYDIELEKEAVKRLNNEKNTN